MFDKMHVRVLLSLVICVHVSFAGVITIYKCCQENEQLDSEFQKCVPLDKEQSRNKTIETFSERILRFERSYFGKDGNELRVMYGDFPLFKLDVILSLAFVTEDKFIARDFESPLNPTMTLFNVSCYDFSVNQNRSPICLLTVKLKALNKCCAKNERLSGDARHCEAIPGARRDTTENEIIDANTSDNIWIPQRFAQTAIKVEYRFMNRDYLWKVVEREADSFWKMESHLESLAVIAVRNVSTLVKDTVTNVFCFDEVAEGPLAPRALLAAAYDIRKCCGKGKQFDNLITACIPRPGLPQTGNVGIEMVNWQQGPQDAFWLPKSLRNKSILTRYEFDSEALSRVPFYDDSWELHYSNEYLPYVLFNATYLSNETKRHRTSDFCFEYISDFKITLFVYSPWNVNFMKCCNPNEIISSDGFCMKHNGSMWKPGSSEGRSYFNALSTTYTYNFASSLKYICKRFMTQDPNTTRSIQYYEGHTITRNKWKRIRYCSDHQIINDNIQEVVGSCSEVPIADLFEIVRPLGVVSASMFGAAAVASVVQTETRRTAHGRALASHALCLCLVNAFQAAWFFSAIGYNDENNRLFAYPIYFFMTAGNIWLSAISINIMKGFRQPLGAMAARNIIKKQRNSSHWKSYAYMSLFAWGGGLTLTILAVTMDCYKERFNEQGFITPSFFETRVGVYEFVGKKPKLYEVLRTYSTYYLPPLSGREGALLFYYIPMSLLVLMNGVCVLLTLSKVRSLQRGKSVLQRQMETSSGSAPHNKMYKCVKRLCLTGRGPAALGGEEGKKSGTP